MKVDLAAEFKDYPGLEFDSPNDAIEYCINMLLTPMSMIVQTCLEEVYTNYPGTALEDFPQHELEQFIGAALLVKLADKQRMVLSNDLVKALVLKQAGAR